MTYLTKRKVLRLRHKLGDTFDKELEGTQRPVKRRLKLAGLGRRKIKG